MASHSNYYYSSKTQILIHAVIVCALTFPLIQTGPCFFLRTANFQKNEARQHSPFLYEIIYPPSGSQLANTQVPVICSKCVILALVALFLGRAEYSHAVICAPLSLSPSVHHEFSAGVSLWSWSIRDGGEICHKVQCFAIEPGTRFTCPAGMNPARSSSPGISPSINLRLTLAHSLACWSRWKRKTEMIPYSLGKNSS